MDVSKMPAGIEPADTEYHDYNRLINEASGVLFTPLGNDRNAIRHFGRYRSSLKYAAPRLSGA
jgi:hypothetical protein